MEGLCVFAILRCKVRKMYINQMKSHSNKNKCKIEFSTTYIYLPHLLQTIITRENWVARVTVCVILCNFKEVWNGSLGSRPSWRGTHIGLAR